VRVVEVQQLHGGVSGAGSVIGWGIIGWGIIGWGISGCG